MNSAQTHPTHYGGQHFVQVNHTPPALPVQRLPHRHPLVFISSFGSDLRIWGTVAANFERHHSLIRYDRRGYGPLTLLSGRKAFDHTRGPILCLVPQARRATLIAQREDTPAGPVYHFDFHTRG